MLKVSVLVSDILEAANRRIKRCATSSYVEFANRNVHRSSFAVTGTFDELSKSIDQEIREVFIQIHKLKIGLRELAKIQTILVLFVDAMFEDWKQYLIQQKTYSVGGESTAKQYEEFISSRISEAKTIINLEYLITKEKIIAKRRHLFWDIGKIGVTAVVGGVIGAYLKSIFP